ncbi:MAG: hypothetical protein V4732_22225 [Pseudomonadota bacterium]
MANGLFRPQALGHRQPGLYGSILLLPQLSHTLPKKLLLPTELLHSSIAVRKPMCPVTALLVQPVVHAYGKEFSLKPGMTLSVDITVKRI